MNMSTGAFRRLRAALPLVLWAAVLVSGSSLAAQQDRTFGEEKRITAVDLVLGFEAGAVRDWATGGRSPNDLRAQDFEIFYDRLPRPVIALETGAGEWQIVIYFDASLTGAAGLRWAATALAGRSDELTELGEVTIMVADPAPWTLLPPTRDRDRLNASLSQLARFQEGHDELLALRAQVVKEFLSSAPLQEGRAATELDADLLSAVAAEEVRLVRARHDDLLLELAEHSDGGPYRALLIASGGYDLRPHEFYRSLIDDPAEEPPAAAELGAATDTLARTLAAYGWVVLPLLAPEGDPLKEGVRIGKLRLTGPSVEVEDKRADWQGYNRTILWLVGARYEGKRKPKRAEDFLELGTALHDQGKLAEAEDALRQAIYHFAGDPKTAERQAAAFARLGAVLEAREQTQEANAALRLARRLDPDVAIAAAGPIAGLLDPVAPLETLAESTAGEVVRGAGDLASALDRLRRRIWLTYQVAGPPDGDLHALEARFKRSRGLIYPGWIRSSTLESVSAARARRLLAGEPTGGTLAFSAEFVSRERASATALREEATAGNGEHQLGEIHLALEPPQGDAPDGYTADPAAQTMLRLTLGIGGPDVEPTVEHRSLGSQTGRETWSYRVGFEMPEDRSWLAVLVEDLETGAWGGRLIEVP